MKKSDILTPLQQDTVDRIEQEAYRAKQNRQRNRQRSKRGPKLPNGKQRELTSPSGSPYAHAHQMRRSYLLATVFLIKHHGWNCFRPFNVVRPRW